MTINFALQKQYKGVFNDGFEVDTIPKNISLINPDFFVRDTDSLIPIEVKANDASTPSLNSLIVKPTYEDIKYGIKLANKNIGFNGKFYTIPYFLTFMLKRFLKEKNNESSINM